MSETTPVITEIKLEPTYSKGELVPDEWWVEPQPKHRSLLRRHWLFIVTFCLPVALASLYLGVIASNQFISQTSFIVRTSAHSDVGNFASLMQGQKLSRASDETYAVAEYLTSRDAMRELAEKSDLREILSRPVADIVNRFPNFYSHQTDEDLYQHFERFLNVKIDSESGICTLSIRAFTPSDAHDLAAALLQDGEALVNRLNARAYNDALRFAKQLIEEQKAKVITAEEQLTVFRNAQKVIDPNKESATALESVGKMMFQLMELEASYNQQSAMTAQSPSLAPMLEKIRSYRDEIAKERAEIAGNESSIAGQLAEYDNLLLNRELAVKGLEAAVVHLASARQDAEQQQLYLQTIINPNYADQSRYPKRFLMLFIVIGLSFCVFWIARAILNSTLEHQA